MSANVLLSSFVVSTECCRPRGLCNHCTHSTGDIPGSVCPCLHWVHLQEAFTCFLPGHLGLLGCHGLSFYVFWRNHLSLGSGKKDSCHFDTCCYSLLPPVLLVTFWKDWWNKSQFNAQYLFSGLQICHSSKTLAL